MNIKEIKSIDLSSFTTVITAINLVFSIIATIILSIVITLVIPNSGSLVLYLIPTIIVGTFMFSIYNIFCDGMFYNLLSKKLKTIAFEIKDTQIVKISTTETAMMVAIISTIQIILIYLATIFILPLMLSSVMQTLILTGQQTVAYSLYQLMGIISQPTTVLMFIFGVFIITFVFTLLGTYIYNFIASKDRGISLKLSESGNLTQIDSIDTLKIAIATAIIAGMLSIITGAIQLVNGASVFNFVFGIIAGFVCGFIMAYLFALIYNIFADKVGKIKLELIDYKIN